MSGYWEYLSGVISVEWGSSRFQWFFYLSILLVLLLEKRRAIRVILGWFPLLFLAVVYNPLFSGILSLFVNKNLSAYLSRLFTFIPLLYVMAYGAMLLLSKAKDDRKFICVCFASFLIVLFGSHMYHQGWMHPAENPEKVPRDAKEAVSVLGTLQDEDLCVAAPQEIAVYLRQLDARLVTPYTRYANKLGRELMEEQPDPVRVMTWAGEQAVDVVIIREGETTRGDFEKAGWKPFAETSSYLLYQVTGVPRLLRTLNKERRIASRTTLDAAGNPVLGKKGYVTVRYEYNEAGDVIRVSYFDETGQPMIRKGKKYASVEYVDHGEAAILVRYYDLEGNLIKEKQRKRK